MISDNLEVGVVQSVASSREKVDIEWCIFSDASSKEKVDIEWWTISDVDNIWRWAWRSPSQAPKRRKT